MALPFWLQLSGVFGFVHVHGGIFCTGSLSRRHAHPRRLFLFLIRLFFLLALFFLTVVTPTKFGASPSVQPPLLALPRPLRDLFKEGEPKESFSRSCVFLLNLGGETCFRMGRCEADESLERTSGQRRRLKLRLSARSRGGWNGRW